MSVVKKIEKKIILKFEDRVINLPNDIKLNIDDFWKVAKKENKNLYNGEDFVVEKVTQNDEIIEFTILKTSYSHYLYDERVGIKKEKCRCLCPWAGILLITNDDYFVIGEMNKTTSVPYCLQIPGGGIDSCDIKKGIINVDLTIKRELKEELNLDLEDIDYNLKFIEYPDAKRNTYGFIAIGKIDKNKNELNKHFLKYKKHLKENNLDIEFDKLVFLKKENAMQELELYNNSKRPYLKNLVSEAIISIKK